MITEAIEKAIRETVGGQPDLSKEKDWTEFGMDSLDEIEFIMLVEEELDVPISDQEIDEVDRNIDSLVELLKEKLEGK